MIKYIVEAKKWRDKINGNTYHSVNITSTETNKLIFSSGLTYGYGEQYRHTAIKGLIRLGLIEGKDKNCEELIYFNVDENALKRDLKKVEIDKEN